MYIDTTKLFAVLELEVRDLDSSSIYYLLHHVVYRTYAHIRGKVRKRETI